MHQDKSFRVVLVGTLIMWACLPGAQARIGGTPFSFSLSQQVKHESNVLRQQNAQSDNIASTTATLKFDKAYGRQNYSAALEAVIERFQRYDIYNNNATNATLQFSSDLGASSRFEIEHQYSRSRQDFEQLSVDEQRTKLIATARSTNVKGIYGLYGRWRLVGDLNLLDVDFDTRRADNRSTRGLRLGLRHVFTDLLYVEVGGGHSRTDYPNLPLFDSSSANASTGDRVKRYDIDVRSNWTLTGLSNFYGQLGFTQERHSALTAGKPSDTARNFDGVTGLLSWTYTPPGKMQYTTKISRDTNNSGGFSLTNASTLRDRLNTNLEFEARWRPTYKLTVFSALGLLHAQEKETQRFSVGGNNLAFYEEASGTRRSVSLGMSYAYERWLSLACSISNAKRTQTIFTSGYTNSSLSCFGTFNME